MMAAPLAELGELKAFLERLFVAGGVIANMLAVGAFHFGALILWHIANLCAGIVAKWPDFVNTLEPTVGFEPTTFTLQKCCSTTELRRLVAPRCSLDSRFSCPCWR